MEIWTDYVKAEKQELITTFEMHTFLLNKMLGFEVSLELGRSFEDQVSSAAQGDLHCLMEVVADDWKDRRGFAVCC